MKNNPLKIILAIVIFATTIGMVYHDIGADELLAVINVKIQKDNQDNIWRVRGTEEENMGTINANKGTKDQINWQSVGSAMVFTFDKDINRYFEFDEGLFQDGYTQRLDANKKLRLTVREDAPQDTLIYNVFVIQAEKYVVGNSPPKVVIQ